MRVMVALMQDNTELFKQYMDNESFSRFLKDTVFAITTSEDWRSQTPDRAA